MPPAERPIPRFVAEPPHELEPYGRWGETLGGLFVEACGRVEGADEAGAPEAVVWFPQRTYAGRTFVPATAPAGGGEGEYFGYVAFSRPAEDREPEDFVARVDFTDETAARNPEWKLDLNEEVIGAWRGPGEARGELTLVWGAPLVPGGSAVTAELDGETVDQCALVQSDRFTLVALDAVTGMGDDVYLEVRLWSKRGDLLASETLYEEEG